MNPPFDLRRAWRFRLLAAAWTCVLLALFWAPGVSGPLPFPHADKLVHAALFFVFGALTVRGVPLHPAPVRTSIVWTIIGAALLGALTEAGQTILTANLDAWDRHGDVWDALADTLGGLLGALTRKGNAPTRN